MTVNGSATTTVGIIGISGTLTYGCTYGGLGIVTAGSIVKGPSNGTFPLDYGANYPNICTSPPAGVTVTNITAAANANLGIVSAAQLAGVPSGIVCDNNALTLSGLISGSWTFVAPSINVGLSGASLTPANSSLPQFWATTGNVGFTIAGINAGTVYAPNGTISLGVANATFSGYLEAQQVTALASGVTLNGTGPVTGGTQTAVLTS